MFTRKGYATSVSGKTANGCPVRSAEPPDKIDFQFISPSADGETLRGLRGFIWKTSQFVEIAACEEAFVYDKIVDKGVYL